MPLEASRDVFHDLSSLSSCQQGARRKDYPLRVYIEKYIEVID